MKVMFAKISISTFSTNVVNYSLQGPMWKQIRGKGYSYGYTILLKANEGLLYLVFSRATNVVGAYKEAREIVLKQTSEKEWDNTLLESAMSSLVFEIIEQEKTIGNAVSLSLGSYFQGVDYTHNRFDILIICVIALNEIILGHSLTMYPITIFCVCYIYSSH